MKYKTLTRLAVRLIGLWFLIQGAASLPQGLFPLLLSLATVGVPWRELMFFLVEGASSVVQLAAGAFLFRGGSSVVDYLIPSNRPYCHECGYELTLPASKHCPECGTEHGRPVSQQARAEPRE